MTFWSIFDDLNTFSHFTWLSLVFCPGMLKPSGIILKIHSLLLFFFSLSKTLSFLDVSVLEEDIWILTLNRETEAQCYFEVKLN